MEPTSWWRDAVVYEIYPRSFADSDGDGIGDLDGITSHLDHIAGLGVDAVWLTPFQRSPQADHGYDVSDYVDVDPLFGDLAAFDRLLTRAHALGLRVIIDIVGNHCSVAHPLFRAALAAGPGSSDRSRFHFRPGRGPHGDEPPNDWPSVFGGSAWTRITERDGSPGEWYLHLYAPEQPDWNWRDARTGPMFEEILRFWFDRGVDGLRVDVAHGFQKADGLPDLGEALASYRPFRLSTIGPACDQEDSHEIFRAWRRVADSYDPPRVLVGEVNIAAERQVRYTRRDELHQAFAFELLVARWDGPAWQVAISTLIAARDLGGAPVTWAVENHDVRRTVTHYGGGSRGNARARAALLAVLGLPGAAYIYQGQELGLPQVDVPEDEREDPAWRRSGVSRDGCRVPLPWTRKTTGTHGFSPGGRRPWLPVPSGWGELSVEAETDDPASMLYLARRALRVRRRLRDDGTFAPMDALELTLAEDGLLTARRPSGFVLALAMGDRPVPVPDGELLLASADLVDGLLPVDSAAWLLRR